MEVPYIYAFSGIAIGVAVAVVSRVIINGLGLNKKNGCLSHKEHEIRCIDRLAPLKRDVDYIIEKIDQIYMMVLKGEKSHD